MKRFLGQVLVTILATVAVLGILDFSRALAADKTPAGAKAANKAHSEAPAAIPEGATTSGAPANGALATGESLQGVMSPEMTKWTTSMKACHKNGKTDQACHDRVMKNCEAKLTKEECSKMTTQISTDASKM